MAVYGIAEIRPAATTALARRVKPLLCNGGGYLLAGLATVLATAATFLAAAARRARAGSVFLLAAANAHAVPRVLGGHACLAMSARVAAQLSMVLWDDAATLNITATRIALGSRTPLSPNAEKIYLTVESF